MISALNQEKINYALVDTYWRVKVMDEVESTQKLLATEKDVQHGEVIVAEYQSAGRGRLDRSFDAPHGASLLFSLYYEPKKAREEWGAIALIVGTSIAETLGENFSSKWPNDVIADGGKVSGSLCEFAHSGVIIGIGINVAMSESELPVPHATSILLETGAAPDRNELLPNLLHSLARNLKSWESGEDFRESYRAHSSTLGLKVSATLPSGEVLTGVATDISSLGELILESGLAVSVGDITHLK